MRIRIRTAAAMSVTLLATWASTASAAITFSPAPGSPYATTDPAFVANSGGFLGGATTGDFNNDGMADVAVVDETGLPVFSSGESVSVLLGSHSDGLIPAPGSPVSIYSGGNISEPAPIASGDFNGDGNTDLAVIDAIHNTLAILLGNGHGEFHLSGTPTPFSGWGAASSLAVGDFNGDGNQDVAVVNGDLNILLGDGSGAMTQAPASPRTLPAFGSSVAAGSFNGDGPEDLAVADISKNLTVYLSNAAGEVSPTSQSPIGLDGGSGRVASADFNRDGNADLAVVSPASGDATVLLGDGEGNFTPASGSPFPVPGAASSSEPGLPDSIAVGNFTCPDVPDLAIANENGSSDSVAVLQGDGYGAFTSPIGSTFPANGNPRSVLVDDLNGDGKPDITVVNPFQGTITALENASTSESCPPPYVPPPPKRPTGSAGSTVLSYGVSSLPTEGPPSIETLKLKRNTIRVGHSLSLRVTLSANTTIVVEFERVMAGHGSAHVHRLRTIGSVRLIGHSGTNVFTIRRVHGHRLAAGRYRLVVFTVTGARASTAKTLALTIRS